MARNGIIGVHATAGAQWDLLVGDAAMPLVWDPGTTHAGTEVYQHPDTDPGWYWFKINPQTASSGAWRNALAVASGDANLYLRHNALPDTLSRDFASERAGSGRLRRAPGPVPGGPGLVFVSPCAAGG